MSNTFPSVNTEIVLDSNDLLDTLAIKYVMDRGLKIRVGDDWRCKIDDVRKFFDFQFVYVYDHSQTGIVVTDKYVATVNLNSRARKVFIAVYALDEDTGRQFIKDARDKIKEEKEEPSDPHVVPISFWSLTSTRGPRAIERDIVVPHWDEIEENYNKDTHEKLSRLFNEFKPSKGGQLILWHGEPGTGKTFALRSLVHSWLPWCSFEYIVDPERFFSDAEYMMHVLLEEPSIPSGVGGLPIFDDSEEAEEEALKERWRLLICEDTGELLVEDAKDITGQGLSRLLNVVDGMIGQGLRVLVLITTNEKLVRMHPAVTRQGRAAFNVEFNLLTPDETVAWAAEHGIVAPEGPQPVANLYGLLEGFEKPATNGKTKAAVGFRPPASHTPWSDARRRR